MGASVIKKQHRMRKWCYDFSLPIVISLAVMATLNSGTLKSAYLLQKSLMDTFVRVRYGSSVTFTEVWTLSDSSTVNNTGIYRTLKYHDYTCGYLYLWICCNIWSARIKDICWKIVLSECCFDVSCPTF